MGRAQSSVTALVTQSSRLSILRIGGALVVLASIFLAIPLRAEEADSIDFDRLVLQGPYGQIPALWHIRLVGADLARSKFPAPGNEKAQVVIMDEAIQELADDRIETPKIEPREIYLPKWSLKMVLDALTPKEEQSSKVGEAKAMSMDIFTLISLIEIKADQIESLDPDSYVKITDPRDLFKPTYIGHGRHVAGTIGVGNQAFGVSHNFEAVELSVLEAPPHRQGEEMKNVFTALSETERTNFVLNMSLYLSPHPFVVDVLEQVSKEKNASVVIAAGNFYDELQPIALVSKIQNATVVSAFSPLGTLAGFSNYGEAVDILAPGVDIFSNGLAGSRPKAASGTSMATPMVAGTLAHLRALLPNAREADLRKILYSTTWDVFETGKDVFSGHGLLNTLKAAYVANRIRQNGAESTEEIQYAVKDSRYFRTEVEYRRAVIQKNKLDPLVAGYESRVYEAALFSSETRALSQVANILEARYPVYAAGLRHLSSNLENESFDSESEETRMEIATESAQRAAFLQAMAWVRDARDIKILESLSSTETLLETYRIFVQKDFTGLLAGDDHLIARVNLELNFPKERIRSIYESILKKRNPFLIPALQEWDEPHPPLLDLAESNQRE